MASRIPSTFTAAHGARRLVATAGQQGGRQVRGELVAALPPACAGVPPGVDADVVLGQLYFVLAWFEHLYRMSRGPGWSGHPLVATGPDATLPELLARVEDRDVADMAAMTGLFVDQHPHLLSAGAISAGTEGKQRLRTGTFRGHILGY